jgi:hypothetical protein
MHRTLHAALLSATLLPSLAAQGDFDLDKVTAGTLGGTLTLQVRNATANFPLLVMVSENAGPTPVALIDPNDPRSVEVGIELLGNWQLLFTSATGTAQVSVPLPGDPQFQGLVFHWQAATFPGATTFLAGISNRVLTQVGSPFVASALPDPLQASRSAATIIPTPNTNAGQGDLLLVSGASSERFGFRTLTSTAGPAPLTPRGLGATAVLNDGRVLFAGGVDGLGAVTAVCEIYNPATDTFTPAASMLSIRAGHAAATMPDGRVLVVGGTTNFTDITTAITTALNTAEIYNPATNAWTAAPNIGGRRIVPSLTKLSTGRMLIAGGIEVGILFGIPISLTSTNKAQLYNPATNSWSNAANMPSGRAYHHDNQVTLQDNRVLLSGGVFVPDLLGATNATAIAGADVYNPATNTWAATTMSVSRTAHAATRLADGRVLVTGGSTGLVSTPTLLDAVAILQPSTLTWTDLAPLPSARAGHVQAILPDGMLLLFSGTAVEAVHF